jgi:murein tripeptide amidase MpaA
MLITSRIESGNIRVAEPARGATAYLEIVPDAGTEFMHWFHFRCAVSDRGPHRFRIVNAGRSRTSEGWEGYRAVASYDCESWFRLPTSFDGEVLTFEIRPERPILYLSHFAAYSLDRHARLLAWCQTRPAVAVEAIGESIEGRPIDLLQIGEPAAGKPVCWITAGQHPGEPMSSWFVEGLLHRLLDEDDGLALALRERAVIYVVPIVNPDGRLQGRLRTNVAGIDLNRAWQSPDAQRSPEVACIRARMERTGVDLFLDIHGDETIPYCFVANSDSVPSITPNLIELRKSFERALEAVNPDFQREHGYPPEEPGSADLSIGANWVGERFGCLSMTLEQPFKDPANRPLTDAGWSPGRCRHLGASVLGPLEATLRAL